MSGDAAADAAVLPDLGPPADPEACNGARHLCGRRLTEVTFVMTHNAHAVDPPFHRLSANQRLSVTAQLGRGVRGLGIKLYFTDDRGCGPLGLYAYHGFPNLGCVPFAEVGAEVADFLAAHPREVLVVTIEGSAGAEPVRDGLRDAGLAPWLYVHAAGEPWPTLGTLIDADRRLVVFKDGDADPGFGLHRMWSLLQDTPYSYTEREAFSCEHLRGPADAPFFLLNHFLTRLSPVPSEAPVTNAWETLAPRILECAATRGWPHFVYVDFVEEGDVLAVVEVLNGPGEPSARLAALGASGPE